jgi:hypothetical protein
MWYSDVDKGQAVQHLISPPSSMDAQGHQLLVQLLHHLMDVLQDMVLLVVYLLHQLLYLVHQLVYQLH